MPIIHRVLITSLHTFVGVKDLDTVDEHTPLAELGMNSMMAVEIKQTLERDCDIFLTAQDIRNLNFAKLAVIRDKDLEREKAETQQTEEESNKISGIQLLIQISNSKKSSTEICMELQTRMDPRKIEVFLLPGIQGCGDIFNPVASRIRPIATALQYGINIESNHISIPEYADQFLPVRIYERA